MPGTLGNGLQRYTSHDQQGDIRMPQTMDCSAPKNVDNTGAFAI